MRAKRGHQRAGIKHTGEVFSEASVEARSEMKDLLGEYHILEDPDRFVEAFIQLFELQHRWDQSWKGHGPDLLRDGIRSLLEKADHPFDTLDPENPGAWLDGIVTRLEEHLSHRLLGVIELLNRE